LKFKFLFLFFNFMIIAFLAIVVCMPLIILGDDLSSLLRGSLWNSLWPLVVLLACALITLDVYYLFNRKLFRLLEREDWPALVEYLEMRVLRQGRYSGHLVRLLANTCLVMSDSGAVRNLENKLALVKPALVERNALTFGAARILGKDYEGALRFFAARDKGLDGPRSPFPWSLPFLDGGRTGQWLVWYHGFSLLLGRRFAEAAGKFSLLAREARDPVVAALAAWFLVDNLSKIVGPSCLDEAAAARERIRGILKRRKDWEGEVAKTETEIYAAIMRRYINDAGNWIYQQTEILEQPQG
jgi:hypothetical protein